MPRRRAIVLPGRDADLKHLLEWASVQRALLFGDSGIESAADAELDACRQSHTFTRNSKRSHVSSMNLRKDGARLHLARSHFDQWKCPFRTSVAGVTTTSLPIFCERKCRSRPG
jgi:hypothetical protein